MSTRQRLRKAKKVAAKKEALRQWRAQKRLYRVAFPWKQLFWLLGSLVVVGILIWLVPQGIIWLANSNEISGPFGSINKQELMQNRFATLVTTRGDIKLELMNNVAPKTSANFVLLARESFYDGVKFHRVIDDFMIQTGDPFSKDNDPSDDGTGGPGYQFEDESNRNTPLLVRGIVAMANSGPDTNGSQFFIITAEAIPHLDGVHTPFGRIVGGMEVVDEISKVKTNDNDYPLKNIIINEVILSYE